MTRIPEWVLGLGLVAVLGVAVAMQRPADDGAASGDAATMPHNDFVIRGARVFDGRRDLGEVDVVVRAGTITAVGEDVDTAGLAEVDGRGQTVLPGLIDAHVHAWGDAQRDMARLGVTAGLDMHGMAERLPMLRQARQNAVDDGQADLWAAGYAVTVPGGHGTQYGFPVPALSPGDDVAAFVAARVDEGADFIKLIVEDLSAFGAAQRLPTLSPAQVREVVAASHAHARLAVAHVATAADARMVIDAGSDGLVHVFTDQVAAAGLVTAMREGERFIVPTLAVVASMAGQGHGAALAEDVHLAPRLTAEQRATLGRDFGGGDAQRLARAQESVRRLHAAGVEILAGSDAPNPGTAHGASLHHELELLVQAGLTPAQALAAATAAPAQRFGLADRGRIAPGMRADLVLVAGDPLRDITRTRDITAVWKHGRVVAGLPGAGADDAGVSVVPPGVVSRFDGATPDAAFGSWQDTTDAMAGGASTVRSQTRPGEGDAGAGALVVTGEVRPGFAFPWAGVMFFPAQVPMQPADLRGVSELVFGLQGDGRTYTVMLFTGADMQAPPVSRTVVAGPQWQQVRMPLADFAGADLSQVRGIAWTAGAPQGAFTFTLGQVALH